MSFVKKKFLNTIPPEENKISINCLKHRLSIKFYLSNHSKLIALLGYKLHGNRLYKVLQKFNY